MIKIHPNTHTTSQRLVAWTSFLNFSMNSIAVCVPSSWGLAQIEGTSGAKTLVKERSLPLYATFGLYYVIFQHQDCILEHICYRNFVYFLTTIPALPHARRVSSPSAWPLRASCSFPGFSDPPHLGNLSEILRDCHGHPAKSIHTEGVSHQVSLMQESRLNVHYSFYSAMSG